MSLWVGPCFLDDTAGAQDFGIYLRHEGATMACDELRGHMTHPNHVLMKAFSHIMCSGRGNHLALYIPGAVINAPENLSAPSSRR